MVSRTWGEIFTPNDPPLVDWIEFGFVTPKESVNVEPPVKIIVKMDQHIIK